MAERLKLVKRRDITMYVTPWCWQANKARELLGEWDIPFQEIDISQDEAAAQQLEAWNKGNRSVPTFDYSLVVVEPRDDELRRLLRQKVRVQSVEMYTTSWCPHVRIAGAYLEQQGVPYREISLEADPDAAATVEGWTGGYRSAPTLVLRLLLTEPTPQQLADALGIAV